jgi:hypothetical protein
VRKQDAVKHSGLASGKPGLVRSDTGMALQERAVPVTTQTRLPLDLVLPLRGRRGFYKPLPSSLPAIGHLSDKGKAEGNAGVVTPTSFS